MKKTDPEIFKKYVIFSVFYLIVVALLSICYKLITLSGTIK